MLSSVIKKDARRALSPYLGQAIAVILLQAGINIVISAFGAGFELFSYAMNTTIYQIGSFIISSLSIIVSFLILTPISLGAIKWFSSITTNTPFTTKSVFHFFKTQHFYKKSLHLELEITIRVAGFFIISMSISSAIIAFGAEYLNGNTGSTLSMMGIGVILLGAGLLIISLVFTAIIYLNYYSARFLISNNNHMSVRTAITSSKNIAKLNFWKIVKFELSFWWMWLLSILIFPLFYVIPYHQTAKNLFIRYLSDNN